MNLHFFLQKLPPHYGTATVTFTNIQLQVSTARPVLGIIQVPDGNVQLRWATTFDWYIPQGTTDLETDLWTTLTNQPSIEGNQFVLEVTPNSGSHFFRLSHP